ncbi:MAG: hypothetical protein ACFFDI_02750 [Promethearchaeota archaeon]
MADVPNADFILDGLIATKTNSKRAITALKNCFDIKNASTDRQGYQRRNCGVKTNFLLHYKERNPGSIIAPQRRISELYF